MKFRPAVVAFDIIETVCSLEPLREPLRSLGRSEIALELWFAQLLRDGMALDAAGDYRPFQEVARSALEVLMVERGVEPQGQAVEAVLQEFSRLPCHPDAHQAFTRLRGAGIRIIALTNGDAQLTRKLLQGGGLDSLVERVISGEEVEHWKPRREVYLHAARIAGVEPQRLALAATHPWDVQGAAQAGLITGFVARGKLYPPSMTPPDVVANQLAGVAEGLATLGDY